MSENTRFIEIGINNWLLSNPAYADSLNKNIRIAGIDRIQQKYNTEFVPYAIELASSWSPLNDNWFSIKLKYDVMSPKGKIWVSVVKRFENNYEKIPNFLSNLKVIEDDINSWLSDN